MKEIGPVILRERKTHLNEVKRSTHTCFLCKESSILGPMPLISERGWQLLLVEMRSTTNVYKITSRWVCRKLVHHTFIIARQVVRIKTHVLSTKIKRRSMLASTWLASFQTWISARPFWIWAIAISASIETSKTKWSKCLAAKRSVSSSLSARRRRRDTRSWRSAKESS